MEKFVKISLLCIGFGIVFTLAGCAHHQTPSLTANESDSVSSVACANNAYLKQYDCSLQRVEQAAETNEPDAQYALGYMYYNGIGTVKDQESAMVWIKRAAAQGQPLAIDALKTIHRAQFPNMGQIHVGAQQTAKPVVKQAMHHVRPITNLNSIPKQHYTVQLIASPNLAAVQHMEASLPKTQPATIASTKKHQQTWYILIVGNFESKQQAQQYVQSLPAPLQKAKPWIRSFASLDHG